MNEGGKNPLNLADQKHFLVFHSYLKYVWLRSESIIRHCNDAMLILLEKSDFFRGRHTVSVSVFLGHILQTKGSKEQKQMHEKWIKLRSEQQNICLRISMKKKNQLSLWRVN